MITALSLSPAVDKIYFIDGFEAGRLYRVKDVIKSAGGKGANVSRVVSQLGENVCALGFKAGDAGQWIEAQLKTQGVETLFIPVEGESRTNVNILDRTNGNESEVLEIGPVVKPENVEAFMKSFTGMLKPHGVLVCSGGMPQGMEPCFYAGLIKLAREAGMVTILDASGVVLEDGIGSAPYLVKPNIRELSDYAGKPLDSAGDIVGACRLMLDKGVGAVTASMGREGAMLVSDGLVLQARIPSVKAQNAIGSGDSLVAGMAVGFQRKLSLDESFRLGVACSVVNALSMEIGYIEQRLVDRYMSEIQLYRLA